MSSYQPFSATHGPGGGFDTGKSGFLTDHQLALYTVHCALYIVHCTDERFLIRLRMH